MHINTIDWFLHFLYFCKVLWKRYGHLQRSTYMKCTPFTIPFSLYTAILYYLVFDECHISCITMEQECNTSVSLQRLYTKKLLSVTCVVIRLFHFCFLINFKKHHGMLFLHAKFKIPRF